MSKFIIIIIRDLIWTLFIKRTHVSKEFKILRIKMFCLDKIILKKMKFKKFVKSKVEKG